MTRLEPSQPAPAFTLADQNGREVSLSDFAGRGVVLFFYPAAMTPGCTTEACDFRDSIPRLQAAGYEVAGISPDEPAKLRQFADQESLTYPLLSDPSTQTMQAYGAYGEKSTYGKKSVGVIRSTVVVDGDGAVRLAKYDIKATGHVAALSTALGLP